MTQYRPRFVIKLAGKDITADVSQYVISLEYCDYLDGQSDEISITLQNENLKWCDQWHPDEGDALEIGLGYHDGDFIEFSKCEIDTIEYDFKPDTVRVRGLSAGVTKSVRTRKGRLYEKTTLAAIAKQVAKRNNLKLTGTMLDIKIDRITQYYERDLEFLARLAREYNHSFKIVGDTLVFTHKPDLENQPAVRTIDYEQVIDLRIREKIKDIVSKVQVTYHNPKTKKRQKRKYKTRRKSSGDTLKIVRKGQDESVTSAQAQAAINEANEDRCTADLQLLGDPKLVAGNNMTLTGIGKLNGQYLINRSRHSFSRSNGYTTSLELKRVDQDNALEEDASDDNE